MGTLTRIILLCCLMSAPVVSDWGYYRGDIATFPASNSSAGISESIHHAVAAGLDWVVLSAPPGTGAFVGQNDIVEEIKLTIPRLTPLLATGWRDADTDARVLGIDSRAPIPQDLPTLLTTVRSHKALAVVDAQLPALLDETDVTTFSPVVDGDWSPAIEPGDAWDRALSRGRRVFIATTSRGTPPAASHETTVWAEGGHADQIIDALREGSSYVADRDGIRLDLQIDGHTYGQTVFHEGEPFVRIRAYARHPITTVSLIADGVEIWSTQPNTTIWEERFFLPANDHTYVRAVLHSAEGGYRTLSNPIFLVAGRPEEGELPLIDPGHDQPTEELVELGGIIEALAGLSEDAQARILREFLSDPATRYGITWLLQNRSDIVGDRLLARIARTDENIEARLGAAYALVTRGSDEAPAILLGYLDDTRPSLARYAARMFAHYTEGFTETDWPAVSIPDPETRAFLIRAYRPTRFVVDDVSRILNALSAADPVLVDAASDKLVELGTRHFPVIEVLLDATEGGTVRAAEILGIISDHRTVSRLQAIFSATSEPSLKRAVFLSLARMGAPYPDRQTVNLPVLSAAPRVDGNRSDGEWSNAARLAVDRLDWDGRPSSRPSEVLAGRWQDSVYVFLAREIGAAPVRATLAETPEHSGNERIVMSLAPVAYGKRPDPVIHLTVNSLGVHQSTGGLTTRAVSRVTSTEWRIELALPASAFIGRPRFNVSVIDGNGPEARETWSVTYGAPEDPSRFGELLTRGLDE